MNQPTHSAYNHLTALTLENFRAYGHRQRIPLRPITLLYGPNSSGKSTILRAFDWIGQLGTGQGLNLLPRLLHRFDSAKPLRLGYDLAISPPTSPDFVRAWLNTAVKTVRVEATFATAEQVASICKGFVTSPKAEVNFNIFSPRVWSASLIVDGKEFLTWQTQIQTSTGDNLSISPYSASLYIASIATDHPLAHSILAEAKAQALAELNERLGLGSALLNVSSSDPQMEETWRDTAQRDIRSLEEKLSLLSQLDLASITRDDILSAAEEVTFPSDTFPPRAFVSDRYLLAFRPELSESFNEGLHSFAYSHLSVTVSPKTLVLEHFERLLALSTHWLTAPVELNFANDPISEMLFIPTLRSIPSQPFVITDPGQRRQYAPDWPAADAKTFARANSWLASLKRPDTAYALRSQPVRSYLGEGAGIREQEHLQILGVEDLNRGVIVNFDELGAGFSQFVPILLAAFNNDDSLVLIEQPELHLHPALQAELADLFAATACPPDLGDDSTRFKQYIIETHSEHLLLRLMRRIRQTSNGTLPQGAPPLRPADLAVLYVQNDGDHSTVSEMPINDQGELVRDWPGGFFEEGLRELLL